MTTIPQDVRNPQAERLLREINVSYELQAVPIADIDWDGSLKNQARFEPLDKELCATYTDAANAGAVFPACIIGRNGNKRLRTADGIHRIYAHRMAGRKLVWAYVFEYDQEDQFRLVSYTANARLNGKPNSLAERIAHASHLVATGASVAAAALACQVSANQVKNYISASRVRIRFAHLGIPTSMYDKFSDSQLENLGGALLDQSIRPALDLIKDGVSHIQVLNAVRATNRNPAATEAERIHNQVRALNELKDSCQSPLAAVTTAQKSKEHLIHMRLKGSVRAIKDAINSEYDCSETLQEIRELVCK